MERFVSKPACKTQNWCVETIIYWASGFSIYILWFLGKYCTVPQPFIHHTEQPWCWIEATRRQNRAGRPLLGGRQTECTWTLKQLFVFERVCSLPSTMPYPHSSCSFQRRRKNVEKTTCVGLNAHRSEQACGDTCRRSQWHKQTCRYTHCHLNKRQYLVSSSYLGRLHNQPLWIM